LSLPCCDDHHEVYPIDNDIHPSIPFVSNQTCFTYYGLHEVYVSGTGIWFIMEQPVLAGEMTDPESPTAVITLFEGFLTITGVFKGKPVTGWGTSEQSKPL
jgi:hypothetical protein